MNREQAKALLPIIQAFADGKEIQRLHNGRWLRDQTEMVIFSGANGEYRLAPEPKWRPWTIEEAPHCFMARTKYDQTILRAFMVDHCDDEHRPCYREGGTCGTTWEGYDVLLSHWERVLEDGSVTPCGVLEAQP